MDEYACGGSPCLDSTTTTRLGTNSCHGQMPGFDPNDVFSDLEPFPEVAAFSDCTTSSPDLLVLPELHPVPSVSFCSPSAIAASNEKTRREALKPFPEVAAFSDCTTSSPDLLVLPDLHPVPSVSFCSTSAIAASNEKTRREARKVKNQKLHSAKTAMVSACSIAASQKVSTALEEL